MLINESYGYLRLCTNYLQPSMRLIKNSREGSKVKKRYDKPGTLPQRVLTSEHITKPQNREVSEQYQKLNPTELKLRIMELQNCLLERAAREQTAKQNQGRLAVSRKG